GLPDEVRPLVQEINLLFDRLQVAFDTQTAFVANAAHELRSPLTALRLQAQALERSESGLQREQAAARLHEGIERAIRLMHQLLLLARHDGQGPHETQRQDVALEDLVREVVGEVLAQARERGIDIGVLPSEAAMVRGDPDALRSLLRNLLENAIKYTPRGGRVDVQVRLESGAPVLSVEDSGPGIAPGERARVFERFVRGSRVQASGSGLGLAIAQAIARAHQASITLGQSAALGGLSVNVRFAASSPPV
ncbi:MAG: ATP-binding protein, partial [Burkholderiaceae bacterium]